MLGRIKLFFNKNRQCKANCLICKYYETCVTDFEIAETSYMLCTNNKAYYICKRCDRLVDAQRYNFSNHLCSICDRGIF